MTSPVKNSKPFRNFIFYVFNIIFHMGGPGQKPWNKQPQFFKLLILVHLRNYFIETLNNFLMCFEIMG